MQRRGTSWGVVLAAGQGRRFGGAKQFATIGAGRLVDLAVSASLSACDRTAVVVPPATPWCGPKVDLVVDGGDSRTASVRAALAVLPSDAAVIVLHGASHPLALAPLFETVISEVRAGAAAAVPGVRPSDVVRRVRDGWVVENIGRDDLVLVQTPAAFQADVLRTAHADGRDAIEDTELVAALGEAVRVVPGDADNIHVVSESDLALAACLLRYREQRSSGV